MTQLAIAGCTYRMDGYLDTAHFTPSGAYVSYHIECGDLFRATDYLHFPAHARAAMRRYSDTLGALLSAGI